MQAFSVGLGLDICDQLVKVGGHDIQVSAAVNRGW